MDTVTSTGWTTEQISCGACGEAVDVKALHLRSCEAPRSEGIITLLLPGFGLLQRCGLWTSNGGPHIKHLLLLVHNSHF